MAEKRGYPACLRLGGVLYAFGGLQGATCLTSVERFDTKVNWPEGKWEQAPPMNVPRSQAACFCKDGVAWLCGGNDGHHFISSVSRFYPATGHWETYLPNLLNFRGLGSAGWVDGLPCLVGGYDG